MYNILLRQYGKLLSRRTVYIVYREPWYVSHILHSSLHNKIFFAKKDVINPPPLILRNFLDLRGGLLSDQVYSDIHSICIYYKHN